MKTKSVFTEGPTALIVSSGIDPDVTLDEFAKRGFHPKLWVPKLTGDPLETGGDAEIKNCMRKVRPRGLLVGGWIQCGDDPAADVASVMPWLYHIGFIEFCCEIEYKGNPPFEANALRADQLVAAVKGSSIPTTMPIAIITYGKRDLYMRNHVFKKAGYHIVPEAYDGYTLDQADTYVPMFAGREVHPLVHNFDNVKYRGNRVGIYRPEGLL